MKASFSLQIIFLGFLLVMLVCLLSCNKESVEQYVTAGPVTATSAVRALPQLPTAHREGTPVPDDNGLIFDCASCDTSVAATINSNFNGTALPGSDYLWVNLHIKINGTPSFDTGQLKLALVNGSMAFTAGGAQYTSPLPNSQIVFDSSVTAASTTWNGTYWLTKIPVSQLNNSELFMTGLAIPIPAGGFPGGIKSVGITATYKTNHMGGVNLQWQWSAAVYTQFTSDYNAIGLQLIHTNLHAGTPVNYESYVTGGAMGGGGSNYTGSWSATGSTNW